MFPFLTRASHRAAPYVFPSFLCTVSPSAKTKFPSWNLFSVLYPQTPKKESRFHCILALLWRPEVILEESRCSVPISQPLYPLSRMWQLALDELRTPPLAISHIISPHTLKSPNSICPHGDVSSCYVHSMKSVVLVVKYPHGSIQPMIVTMQKWITIFNLLIQYGSVPCSCSTVAGGSSIIAIMISYVWDQTSVNN